VDNQSDPPFTASTIIAPNATESAPDEATFGDPTQGEFEDLVVETTLTAANVGVFIYFASADGSVYELRSHGASTQKLTGAATAAIGDDDGNILTVGRNEVSFDTPNTTILKINRAGDSLAFFTGTLTGPSAAIPDATDEASAISSLNELLAYLRTLGLVTP
jgi:hypothetical protein